LWNNPEAHVLLITDLQPRPLSRIKNLDFSTIPKYRHLTPVGW
jgi:hypothetical protein